MSGFRGADPAPTRRLVLGRYALTERFHGGMAEVWKAQDLRLDRTVVAKFLRVADRGTHAARRFLREARILAGIDDPRVVRVHDVDEAEIDGQWHLYLITQFVDGRTLREALPRGTALAVDHALRRAAELCEALVPVHEQNLVHRDVKPGNVMIRRVGAQERLVLLDFGIARSYTVVGDVGRAAGVTGPGQLIGTPEYMAPERFLLEPDGPATDLYAVGCVLFEMLTGQQPYLGPDYGDLARLHCHAPVPSPRALRPAVPADVDELVVRLLAKRPGDRPADARGIAEVLRELGGGRAPRRPRPADPEGLVESRCTAVLTADLTPDERVRRLAEVADLARDVLPADHAGAWLVALHLARALHTAKNPAAAADRLAPVAARIRQVLGPVEPLARTSALNLARYLGESGHPAAAAKHLAELRAALAGTLAPADPRLCEVRFDLAHWLAAAGEDRAAGAEYRALYTDHCEAYGPAAPETVRLYELINQAASEG
ncbi:serine/threonine-protein kinase [Streptomyces antimicrobicus]|uniref:non-specific serine/threonine protein kinase n=1 Tax=Streptomyces antimicrobicus TaxID=2883108 RepID=A0ABS8B2L2_9ACTN|nr:serine/threonine-protein kinase [Streptomyces antimicrobicus]MCB5178831.1 serine/threonine protein kinase [Streptomyces antimicrobicus]